jgi:hypothetical protein
MPTDPGSREQLMGLITRTLPSVPSLIADAILKSQWLKDHDEQVRNEVLEDLAAKEEGAVVLRGKAK